jgi:tol-pal system protein YbgF
LKKHATLTLLAVALLAWGAQPAYCVSKETLQMMQQLDALQQAVQNMQKTLDTQTAVLKTLIEQANDNVNSMKTTVGKLSDSMGQNLASTNARFDTSDRQVQALSESLEEVKARLAKLSEQMAQTQNIIQTLNQPPATPGTGATTPPGGDAPTGTKPPDGDTLYKSGLSYYGGGQYPLAVASFQDYLKYYGDTDLASNAQFYVGDCYYAQGNYAQAIQEYDKCLERYPGGNKQAVAQLKKGYALLELNQKEAGIRELRAVVRRFADSHEADLARQRLKKLGISVPRRRGDGE